jgi:phage shock protein C
MATSKRLYRSRTNRKIAGVCGGLGEYLEIDPTLIRLAFVILFFAGGAALALYLIMWVIVPEGDAGDWDE